VPLPTFRRVSLHQRRPAAGPRQQHELVLLDHLRRRGRVNRAELVSATGLSRATISSLSADLLARQLIIAVPGRAAGTGRPPEDLALNPDAGLVLGVDFGHHRVALVVADAAHEVIGSTSRRWDGPTGWDQRAAVAVAAAEDLLGGHGRGLAGIGTGVPGGIVNRPAVVDTLTGALTSAFGVPVREDNNTRLAGLAETIWGAARGLPDVAYIRLSNGVGGALVLGGRIHAGPRGTAGEFGHICVDPAGPVCRCSNHGCLEAHVGLDRLLAATGAGTVAALHAACEAGDPGATAAVARAGRLIGGVLASVATTVDVAHFVLGGELTALREHLTDPVRRTLRRQVAPGLQDALRVEVAALGDYAGALGAIAAVLHDTTVALDLPHVPPLAARS